jgi:hypothetical protein
VYSSLRRSFCPTATRRELVPIPDLKSQVMIPGARAHRALGHRAGGRLLDGSIDVLGAHVATHGVVQPRIVALADEGMMTS